MKIKCEYCDSLYEDAEFCPHCGAPRPGTPSDQAAEPKEELIPEPVDPSQEETAQEETVQEEIQNVQENTTNEPVQDLFAGQSHEHKWHAVIAYLTWVGWIAAFLMRDKEDDFTRHHLNQALCVNLIETIGTILGTMGIAAVSEIVDMVAFVLWIIGIFRAIRGSRQPLPIIGNIEWIR